MQVASKKFFRINNKIHDQLAFLGLDDYTKKECRIYWNALNKSEIDLSKYFYRSYEQTHKYRYFIKIKRKTRITVLRKLRSLLDGLYNSKTA